MVLLIEDVAKVIRYEPETGKLFWLRRDGVPAWWNTRYAGQEALTSVESKGYRQGRVCSRQMMAHRIAWALAYGEWPSEIDHINGIKTDNRLKNLRVATRTENTQHRAKFRTNTSGHKGVRQSRAGRWEARITVAKNQVFLGVFNCKTAAAIAYDRAAIVAFGAFAAPNMGGF
jgi:hypothetical protein